MEPRVTRFSGADWADQLHPIMVVGVGGIGSWLTLNLARIGHELFLIDPDTVDETNVTGGQMYTRGNINMQKTVAVKQLCESFGSTTDIVTVDEKYDPELGMTDICICGLDNMTARREVFEAWAEHVESLDPPLKAKCLFMDGRLTLEMFEIFSIKGNDPDMIKKYLDDHLFTDEEAQELDCTTKQSTWAAMGIASFITGTLCNFLVNQKMGCVDFDFRTVPFYQRVYFPLLEHRTTVPEATSEEVCEAEKNIPLLISADSEQLNLNYDG